MKHLTLAVFLTVVALSTPVFAQDSGSSGGDQSQSSSGQKKHHHHKKQQSQDGQSGGQTAQ